ncbi:MAG: ArnT family glycosyltransferase [Bacteroidia bacterium]
MSNLYIVKSLVFYSGLFLLVLSVFFHVFAKDRKALIFLIPGAFALFIFSSLVVPFLNVWDERFHALVAKNLMHHIFTPTLYDKCIVAMQYNSWEKYHIWLHKQPLFLWQMALSYKLLGINEFAARFPNVILNTAMVYAAYRTGKLLVNERTGYLAGFLMATSSYLMGLVGGWLGLDQNDSSFTAYISLSIWTWVEYIYSDNKWWLVLTGLFSGFAILCKWLVGLLVYLCWGVYVVPQYKFKLKKYRDILISLAITIVIALPWQIYTFLRYPTEAKAAYQYNIAHFLIPLDGHYGPYTFHINLIGQLFGSWVTYLIIPAMVIFYLKNKNKLMSLAFIIAAISVFLFFSLAQTKMSSFTLVAILPMYIFIAFFADFVITRLQRFKFVNVHIQKVVTITFLLVLLIARMDFKLTEKGYLPGDDYKACYAALEHNKEVFRHLSLPSTYVIFNVPQRHYIEAMFYTNSIAYNFIPTYQQYLDVKKANCEVALFKTANDTVPEFLKTDTKFILIKDSLSAPSCE